MKCKNNHEWTSYAHKQAISKLQEQGISTEGLSINKCPQCNEQKQTPKTSSRFIRGGSSLMNDIKVPVHDFIVVNERTKKTISEHATRQEAWTAWQNAWMAITDDMQERDNFHIGTRKSMQKYLR